MGRSALGVLKRPVPSICSRRLTGRLRLLERAGAVVRDHRFTTPPQVTYSLTPRDSSTFPFWVHLTSLPRVESRRRTLKDCAKGARCPRDCSTFRLGRWLAQMPHPGLRDAAGP
jgi:DNA-binding HxlR family transcriptional regulator